MNIIEITSVDDPRVAPYTAMTESSSLRDAQSPVIIAESPKVIRVALAVGYEPLSLLCELKHIDGDAADIVAALPADTPIFTGSRSTLSAITGYTLTRGVLCALRRSVDRPAADVCAGARRIAVMDQVCDTTNIGAIFRSAAALGIDGLLLTRGSCNPWNRRAVRVSMGAVFLLPWAWIDDAVSDCRALGLTTVAMALTDRSVAIDDPAITEHPRLAIILGTEGDGLAPDVISRADITARIPMARGIDSLNVATAAALAFWQLHPRD
ncbi:MAG: RNA methyltransferase [Roseburia sp.]|nr:RNA methyltransferase [Roseburia sp.]